MTDQQRLQCSNCFGASRRCLYENEQPNLEQLISEASNDNHNICFSTQLKEVLYSRKKFEKQVKLLTENVNMFKKQVKHLTENVNIFREETPYDILVKPGQDNGSPPIPAHRAILASKSPILKDMLIDSSSDLCKAPSTPNETLTFSELNHDELKMLLDIIYKGSFKYADIDKLINHATSLLVAAHKYNISSLKDFYEARMVANLNQLTVIRFLEISELSGNTKLKGAAMEFIKKNDDVVYRSEFNDFAKKYPLLSYEITRACLIQEKKKQKTSS